MNNLRSLLIDWAGRVKIVFGASGAGLPFLLLSCIGLLFISVIYAFAYRYLKEIAIGIGAGLLPGYAATKDVGYFKSEILSYILLQGLLIVLFFLFSVKDLWLKRMGIIDRHYLKVFLVLSTVSAVGWVVTNETMTRFYLFFSFIFSSAGCLISLCIWTSANERSNNIFSAINSKTRFGILISLTAISLLILLLPGWQAWSHLKLPNDYLEISDTFNLVKNNSGDKVTRADVIDCMQNKFKKNECSGLKDLELPLVNSADWQWEAGRILFHHSYVYIPAAHYLKYGMSTNVPYLYGYGSTIFQAHLMSLFGNNLSAYFKAYPITLLIGVAAIAVAIGYCAGSPFVFYLAFLVALFELYKLGLVAGLLAASFNPIRYLGVLLQVVSIFYFIKKPSQRMIPLIGAGIFSIFWNFEFGLMGLVSQLLIVLNSGHRLNIAVKSMGIAILISIPIILKILLSTSPDILQSISLGFFQINMPAILPENSQYLLWALLILELGLFLACLTYKDLDRTARLCLMPLMALIFVKPIFNPSQPHLDITLVLIAPMLILFFPKLQFMQEKKIPSTNFTFSIIGKVFLIIMMVSLCVSAGRTYVGGKSWLEAYLVNPFISEPWVSLGEKIPMVTPEKPIFNRVKAIQERIDAKDSLILLSPFDQIINLYVNPVGYCGHFELISNVATKKSIDQVNSCLVNKENILVVYDKTLMQDCPSRPWDKNEQECKKLEVKGNLDRLFQEMLPKLYKLDESDEFIFYRKIKNN